MSSYEEQRRKNLEENLRILNEMEVPTFIKNIVKPKISTVKIKQTEKIKYVERKSLPVKRKLPLSEVDQIMNDESLMSGSRRRSSRLTGKRMRYSFFGEDENEKDDVWMPSKDYGFSSDEDSDGGHKRVKTRPGKLYVNTRPKVDPNRPNTYGEIEGIEVGTMFPSRLDSCAAGIHRPTVAGIHGGYDGAYSIALSGGYEDDVDMGDRFTYTGEGGRDLKGTKDKPKNLRTAPQSCDQRLVRGNLALTRSYETGKPVRVLRGYKLPTKYAPESGYRYDGLYRVEKWWECVGLAGFKVFKFAMRRLDDQAPLPWINVEDTEADENNAENENDDDEESKENDDDDEKSKEENDDNDEKSKEENDDNDEESKENDDNDEKSKEENDDDEESKGENDDNES